MGAWGVNIGSYRRRIIIFSQGRARGLVRKTYPPPKKKILIPSCAIHQLLSLVHLFCLFPQFFHFAFILHFCSSIFLSNFPFFSLSFKFPSFFSSPFCIFPQATSAYVSPLGKYMHSSRGAWKFVFRTLGHRRWIYTCLSLWKRSLLIFWKTLIKRILQADN